MQSGGKALSLLPAKLNDRCAESFQLLGIDAANRAQVGERAWFGHDDIVQNRVAEDEKRGKPRLGGLLFSPVAELRVEGLLVRG